LPCICLLNTEKRRKTIFNCVLCGGYSFNAICKKCQNKYLKPKIRTNSGVVSFYDYESIEHLVKYKYHRFGNRIFKILAQNSFKYLAGGIKEGFYVIPVDDKIKKGFSHTAVLAESMKTEFLTPVYSSLLSSNNVRYAGKSLEFRLKNPRNFEYRGKSGVDVILVDDISTTGLTLKEARECLEKEGVNVALCVVLANLRK